MNIRHPIVAGQFYEASASSCRHHVEKLIGSAEVPPDLPAPLLGGLVPHAGWSYSGDLSALTFKALQVGQACKTLVLFGADHRGVVRRGEVYDSGVWRTPLGDAPIDEELASAVLAVCDCCRANPDAHAGEHSLEVQVPILQVLAPDLRLLPIAVPPGDLAVPIGLAVAEALADRAGDVRIVGSTDLSHHGGHFPAPGGRGDIGEKWTRANDRRMLALIESLDAEAVVAEAEEHGNACGAGAIAATIAACRALGATRGTCLRYTNSYTLVHEKYPYELDDTTVGYASAVFA